MKLRSFLLPVIALGMGACSSAPTEETGSTEDDLVALVPARLGSTHSILQDTIGYNPRFDSQAEPWADKKPDWAAALKESQASMIRYPGGTFGNYWDYDHDQFFPAASTHATTGWVNPNRIDKEATGQRIRDGLLLKYSVEDLALVASGGGAVNVVFHMNLVTPGQDFYESADGWNRKLNPHPGVAYDPKNPDDWYLMLDDRYARFRRMLKRAEASGIRVRFVELGNEYYFGLNYVVDAFPSGRSHGVAANYIADRVHRDFGETRIAAVASCVPGSSERQANWNRGLDAALDRSKVGWVTMHAYKTFSPRDHYDDASFRQGLGDWTVATNRKFESADATRFFLSTEHGPRVWYTETNANWDGGLDDGEGTPASQQKWAQSLADAQSTVHLYEKGNASMILQFYFQSVVRKPGDLAAGNGHALYNRALAMEPFMRASKGATSATILDVHGAHMAALPGTDRTVVQAVCFEAAKRRCAIVNLAGHAVRLNLDAAFHASDVHVEGYVGDIDSADVPRVVSRDANATDVRIPAYAVVTVAPK